MLILTSDWLRTMEDISPAYNKKKRYMDKHLQFSLGTKNRTVIERVAALENKQTCGVIITASPIIIGCTFIFHMM